MLDLKKPVQTRDGRKVRILCTDRYDDRPIVTLCDDEGRQVVVCYLPDGRLWENSECYSDLVNVPEKRSVWVNVYPSEYGLATDCFHRTKAAADKMPAPNRLDCIELTYEVPSA